SQRLARQAQSDAMTEALNRHAFYTLIESRRSGLSVPGDGALAVLDLDHLKPLNDQFGHAAGDAAIRAVAKAVRSIIRPDDLLFRWGGDEFLVILPNVPADEAERRLATLASKLRGTELPGVGEPVDLDVSYGVASFTTLGGIEAAMAQADAAMYAHKADRKLLQPDLPRPAAGG
ncbi:MAG TPA: GGDEF domain-containing protein, partial [Gemmatales bacterium]|nr:GGDEF domain-containing protein [Gemmatales bacterium]